MSPLQEAALAYHAEPSDLNRNLVLVAIQPSLRRIADGVRRRLPRACPLDVDDLAQEATEAVADAMPRYDPGRGVAFSTFVGARAHGAMIDAIRKADCVSRSARARGVTTQCRLFSTMTLFNTDGDGRDKLFEPSIEDEPKDVDAFWRSNLRGCDRKERLMMLMLYREGLTMKEIGHSLGLSESRISQMHSEVIRRLQLRAPSLAN